MVDVMQFKEIEHKFILDDAFNLADFRAQVEALGPVRTFALRVRDRYYLTEHGRLGRYVIRHRYDEDMHHLTIKTLKADPEVRDEINLDLGQHAADQAAAVDAFVAWLGVVWNGTILKDIEVWEFPTCEMVHYAAFGGDRSVRCVEFEAVSAASEDEARAVLEHYERATGFAGAKRSRQSVVDLLFPGALD